DRQGGVVVVGGRRGVDVVGVLLRVRDDAEQVGLGGVDGPDQDPPHLGLVDLAGDDPENRVIVIRPPVGRQGFAEDLDRTGQKIHPSTPWPLGQSGLWSSLFEKGSRRTQVGDSTVRYRRARAAGQKNGPPVQKTRGRGRPRRARNGERRAGARRR